MKTSTFLFQQLAGLILLILLVAPACQKDKDNDSDPPVVEQAFAILDVGSTTDWDYSIIDQSGGVVMLGAGGNCLEQLYFQPANKAGYIIDFNESAMPKTAVIGQYVFLFGNQQANKMDIAAVDSAGEIEVKRDLVLAFEWSSYPPFQGTDCGTYANKAQWSGKLIDAIANGIKTAATSSPNGHKWPVSELGWDDDLIKHTKEMQPAQYKLLDLSGSEAANWSKYLDCNSGNISVCIDNISTEAIAKMNTDRLLQEKLEEEIRVAEAALTYGSGDVQVTLTWDNTSDMDLYVIDPNDEEIYYSHPSSASGGSLDVDDTDGYGPENIFWPANGAITGTYQVYIRHYSGQLPTNYTVLVNAFGYTQKFQGTVTDGQKIHICNFSPNGIIEVKALVESPGFYPVK